VLRPFNLNDLIWVKLTFLGERKLLEFQQKFLPPTGVPGQGRKIDAEGRTAFQLHDFMHIFGESMVCGQEDLFDGFTVWFEEGAQTVSDLFLRKMGAKLVGYNVPYADEFIAALRNLEISPQRDTINQLLQALAKMSR
jgi:hypothetical protein